MEDILSQAINDRLEEKRMATVTISDLREKLLYLLKGKDTISNVTDLDDLVVYEMIYGKKADAITRLFLDTIEKAKPTKKEVGYDSFSSTLYEHIEAENATYNDAVSDFYDSLKKEIGK